MSIIFLIIWYFDILMNEFSQMNLVILCLGIKQIKRTHINGPQTLVLIKAYFKTL